MYRYCMYHTQQDLTWWNTQLRLLTSTHMYNVYTYIYTYTFSICLVQRTRTGTACELYIYNPHEAASSSIYITFFLIHDAARIHVLRTKPIENVYIYIYIYVFHESLITYTYNLILSCGQYIVYIFCIYIYIWDYVLYFKPIKTYIILSYMLCFKPIKIHIYIYVKLYGVFKLIGECINHHNALYIYIYIYI